MEKHVVTRNEINRRTKVSQTAVTLDRTGLEITAIKHGTEFGPTPCEELCPTRHIYAWEWSWPPLPGLFWALEPGLDAVVRRETPEDWDSDVHACVFYNPSVRLDALRRIIERQEKL
jgi:hypothetical protein